MTMFNTIYLVALGIVSFISLSSSYGLKRFPSNRMLDFNWPEYDGKIKKFPHEKYCNYYYQHESGEIFTVRKCHAGEIFDYHIHHCKEKHTAQCWSHRYGKHAIHDHIHSKWRKQFKCPFPNGNYPDIFDCDKYIVCLDGTPHNKHCPPNQQFDKNRRHCVYAAVCANSTDAALVMHMCPYPSGNFAYLQDCSKYYHCHKNKPNVKICEANKLFDEVDRECKDKTLVNCEYRHNPYEKITAADTTAKSVTTVDFTSSISSANLGINKAAVTQTIKSSTQSESTVNSPSSMSPEIMDKISVTKDGTTAELDLQSGKTENFHSSMSPVKVKQKVDQPETTNKSYPSTNASKPTEHSVVSGGSSQSTTLLSNTAESTTKSKATNYFHSSKVSTSVTQSTATA